jgi:hypothetical protein
LTAILQALLTKEPALRPTTPQLRSRLTGLLAGPGDVLDRLPGGPSATVVAPPADTTTRVTPVVAPSRARGDHGESDVRRMAAGAAAAARVKARGPSALQVGAGVTGDADAVVAGADPSSSRWSARWGLLALGTLATLALLALVAVWAVDRRSSEGAGAEASTGSTTGGEVGDGPTTSAGTGVSAGPATPSGVAGPTSAGAATTTTAAARAPTSTTGAGPATIPAGWQPYADPNGTFTIAHPPGWTVRAVDDTRVDFVDPITGSYMRVDWVQPPGESAVGAWRAYAPRFAAENPGYQEIRIEATTFRGLEAAEWEFRYGEGGRLHAVDLGMISGRYGFALNFQTPESEWQALQPIRRGFEGSFQPAS